MSIMAGTKLAFSRASIWKGHYSYFLLVGKTIKSIWERKRYVGGWKTVGLDISASKWPARGCWPSSNWSTMVNFSKGDCPGSWPLVLARILIDNPLTEVGKGRNPGNRAGVSRSRKRPQRLHAPASPWKCWRIAGSPGHVVSWVGFEVAWDPQLGKAPSNHHQREKAQKGTNAKQEEREAGEQGISQVAVDDILQSTSVC